jgi:hypothetical protein
MRQQLVSWLIEDIAPAVRRNHDPEGTILKFAKSQNLEPALVQSLGQLFNTAKTLAYVEKSAHKGDSFPIIDVDKLVADYLEVRPKEARARGTVAFDQFDGPSLVDAFKGVAGLDGLFVLPEETYEEQHIKTANFKPASFREQSATRRTIEMVQQSRADLIEDVREILTKTASEIHGRGVSFDKFESDVLGVHGDSFRSTMDKLAAFCDRPTCKVARAKDGGVSRLVWHNEDLIKEVKVAHDKLVMAQCATEMIGELEAGLPKRAGVEDAVVEEVPVVEKGKAPLSGLATQTLTASPTPPESRERTKPKLPSDGKEERERGASPDTKPDSALKSILAAGSTAAEPFTNLPEHMDRARKLLGSESNSGQKHVDNAYEEAKHLSTLQHLLTTDEVLAEADPEHVVNMYNTLRRLSPSMASDPNIVRVALRTMIQHDGISPFDAKSFLDTEQAQQKVDYNRELADGMKYKGVSPTPSPKPQ